MNKAVVATLGAMVILAVGGGSCDKPAPSNNPTPGDKKVYQRIDILGEAHNCTALQAEFTTAMDNHDKDLAQDRLDLVKIDLAYATYVNKTMDRIGCFDN